jgi:hypothetical protein
MAALALEDLWPAEGYGVAAGPGEVIEAINKGRVGPRGHGYLVFGLDQREVVARCTTCRSLWVEVPTTCPRCQARCVEASLSQELLLLLALRHDLAAYFVRSDPELERRGNIAAVFSGTGQVSAAHAEQGSNG